MGSKQDVVVVGGGIVGLSVAVALAERNIQVTVLEKDRIGYGCSYGNAGWMTPCFALPLPMPGLFLKSLKWLMNPESPLYIKPTLDPLLARWMIRFLLSMNAKQAQAATEALVELSKISLKLYSKLALQHPEIGFEQKGLLMVAQSSQGVQMAINEMKMVSEYGIPGQSMTPEEIRQFEPSLRGELKGGVYFPAEAHAEPLKVVQALGAKAKSLGVAILEGVSVSSFKCHGHQIEGVQTSEGFKKSEHCVLATGSWSSDLAKQLGLNVPILGGKGYALIVPKLTLQPRHPMMLIEKKVAITPRRDSLRIAGTLELVNQDFSVTQRRVQAMIRGAGEFLALPADLKIEELWRGLRPCTPDGVPLIGTHRKWANLTLACGHQMLGLQAGMGTGQLVADLISTGKSELNRAVFDPNRF